MLCQNCRLNEATTKITNITSFGKDTIHLCDQCARAKRENDSFLDFFDPWQDLFPVNRRHSRLSALPVGRSDGQAINILDHFTKDSKDFLRKAAQEAARSGSSRLQGEHLLLVLANESEVAQQVLKEAGIDSANVVLEIEGELSGNNNIPPTAIELSARMKRIIEIAFNQAKSIGQNYVAPQHLLLAIFLEQEGLGAQILSRLGLTPEKLIEAVKKVIQEGGAPHPKSATPNLDKFSRDLTEVAQKGKLDPVIGRNQEIDRLVHILSRRTKNNPVLIGEPGVGKTAIAEGLALKIISGDVSEILKNKRLVALDLAGMVAGTKYRGEFEERLKKVVDEIVRAKGAIIIFVDELHTLVGAGGAEGAIDASNILKPSLARGELQVIGATTLNEYRLHIEKDAALERRFQPIVVRENTKEETVEILRGLRDKYEAHHRVKISDEALVTAAELSDRYLPDRFLPDKAVDLMDEAAAEVRLRTLNPPENLLQVDNQIKRLEAETAALAAVKNKDAKRMEQVEKNKKELEKFKEAKKEIQELWEKDKANDQPIVLTQDIAHVLSTMTGIPVSKLSESEKDKLLKLEQGLHERVVAQEGAIQTVSEAIRRARAGLKDPKKPIGSFMFLGPTGVGKTELSKALAEVLYGSENSLIRLDMSEFQEAHTVARLIGSPPGYVGFDEGGQLTEKVRRHPFSVVLFDEIEKAHPDVFNLLLQVLEDGRLTDGKGRTVDFKNTILIMTSNLGGMVIQRAQVEGWPEGRLQPEMEKIIKSTFKPEFVNRIDEFVMFEPLNMEDIVKIVDLELERTRRLVRAQNLDFVIDQGVKEKLAKEGFDPQYGARPLKRLIQREIENPISEKLINGELQEGMKVEIKLDERQDLVFNPSNGTGVKRSNKEPVTV